MLTLEMTVQLFNSFHMSRSRLGFSLFPLPFASLEVFPNASICLLEMNGHGDEDNRSHCKIQELMSYSSHEPFSLPLR